MTALLQSLALLQFAPGSFALPWIVDDLSESGQALCIESLGADTLVIRSREDPAGDRPRIALGAPLGSMLHLVFEDLDGDWSARVWDGPGVWRLLPATRASGRLAVDFEQRRSRETIEIVPVRAERESDEASDYSYADYLAFMATLPADPRLELVELGTSVQGRPIQRLVFDDKSAIMPAWIKPTVVLLIRQHGDEWPASYVFEGMIDYLLGRGSAPPDPNETEQVRWIFYPLVNPDGAFHHERYNARGVDLNRNWSQQGPQPWQEPEIWLLQSDIASLPHQRTIRIGGDHHGWWGYADGGYRYVTGAPPAEVTPATYRESLKDTDTITAHNPDHWSWYESGGAEGMARIELYRWLGWTVHTPEYTSDSRDADELRESGAAYIRAMRDTGYAITEEAPFAAIGETVAFTLDEPDQNLDPLQVETLSVLVLDYASGDREWVELEETGADTGLFSFRNALPTAAGDSQHSDGVLQTEVGSYAIGYYLDPDLAGDRSIAATQITP